MLTFAPSMVVMHCDSPPARFNCLRSQELPANCWVAVLLRTLGTRSPAPVC